MTVPPLPELIERGAVELAGLVQRGDVSASEVIEAHLARIEQVNGRLNAIVLPLYEQARDTARRIDQQRRAGEPLGPLAGVPISVKECLDVQGTAATFAAERRRGAIAAHDGPLVARLRAAGAVIVGKSNVPQLGMTMETDSPMFGRANNPWRLERSPGGSSGGDAAIVAARGVALALATDAGGSIRQPAHVCGVCGLKPTSGRLTQTDLPVTTTTSGAYRLPVVLGGMHSILQPGPIARSVADLAAAMAILAAPGQEHVDPTVSPATWPDWREVEVPKLRLGVYLDDGVFPVTAAVRRAVDEAAAHLRAAGCVVEPFAPPDVPEAIRTFQSLIIPDGGLAFRRMLAKSPRDAQIQNLLRGAAIPNGLRPAIAWVLERSGQPRLAASVRNLRRLSADEFRQRIVQRAAYQARFLGALDHQRLDAVLCPVNALPAPPHGAGEFLGLVASHTSLYNYLGFPAGTVPVTKVRAGEDQPRAAGRCQVERMARAIETGSAGLPIGVQIAARPWREDVVLAALKAIETRARSNSEYPDRPAL